MTRSETDAVFDKAPEYECRFRDYRICYYGRPLIYGVGPRPIDRSRLPTGDVAESPSEIPYVYAAAQLMFDNDGRLVAYTQPGETGIIETLRGPVAGSSLDRLDVTYFP
jgi:hypothetical protein